MMSIQRNVSICFSPDDLELFSKASHDRNPLHLSDNYARKTPFANRVVFGILGGLACLGHLKERPGLRLSKIVLEFPAPLFVNLPYSLEITETSPEKATVKVFDGRRQMSKMTAYFRTGDLIKLKDGIPQAARTEALLLTESDLAAKLQIEESYYPNIDKLRELINHLKLVNKGVGEVEIATLLWTSYLVGMELPGCQALFSKLTLNFEDFLPTVAPALSYTASLIQFDDRYNLLRTKIKLAANGMLLAVGDIQSFVRPAPPNSTTASIKMLMPKSEALKGKVALVTGASRGLGAAIARSLTLQGCTVLVNFLHSHTEAQQLQADTADTPGEIILIQGDASDLSWCLSAKKTIIEKYGKLDFLICNACPAILPLWVEPTAIERLNDYVTKSLALMSVPMSVFLSLLSEASGWSIVISSIYASQIFPPDLPHYVIAKCAIEGLTKVTASEYKEVSFIAVRPPKLLTDQTNTPIGRQGAISADKVAVKIVERLQKSPCAGQVEIMEHAWEKK
ncbi:MAG TPA: SDR family NAD(P)-dependent oxidoreductase [Elainellaceae cyanobacterium]